MPTPRTALACLLALALLGSGCIPPLPEDDDVSGDDDTGDDDTGDDDTGDDDTGDDDTGGTDADGDGWTVEDGDCDDGDPTVHPEADEDCDGIDTDCDGMPGAEEIDDDGDSLSECQGDCNDFDPGVHPGATEIPGDGIDQDCDGVDPGSATYLYGLLVQDYDNPTQLAGFEVDLATATLTELAGSPWSLAGNAGQADGSSAIALDPLGRFLYVGGNKTQWIEGLGIDPVTGGVSPLPGSPYFLSGVPRDAVVHPSGDFLYVLNEWDEIDAFAIDPQTGELSMVTGSPFPLGPSAMAIGIHPDGEELFSVHLYQEVEVDWIDPTNGSLTYLQSVWLDDVGRPKGLAFDPFGEYVFVRDLDEGIHVLERHPVSDDWQQHITSPFSVGFGDSLVVDPTGSWLYVPDEPEDVQVLEIGAGVLWPAVGSPAQSGTSPSEVAIDPSGAVLFVSAGYDDELWRYTVDPGDGLPSSVGITQTPANQWEWEGFVLR